jgi:phage major head subunit gpT-like protein
MAGRLTKATLEALDTSIKALFRKSYDGAPTGIYRKVCSEVPSESRDQHYPFAIDSGAVREFKGDRVVNSLELGDFKITNQEFELTWGIRRSDVEDDITGMLFQKVRQGAAKFAKHPDRLLASLIAANPTGLDGVALFHVAHPRNPANSDGNTYTNIYAARPLTVENAAAVRAKMMSLAGPDGEPLSPMPRLLLVPPTLEQQAEEVARAMYAPSAAGTAIRQNVMAGKYDVLVMPHLEAQSSSTWYMLDLSDEDFPFIFQTRRALEFVTLFSPEDPDVFKRGEYVWGGSVRYAMGPGTPYRIAKCTA